MTKIALFYFLFFISTRLSVEYEQLIIKHSNIFKYSDFTPGFTSLYALHNIDAEQMQVFGLKVETQLSHYEKYCSNRFLPKFDGSTKTR